MFAICTAVLQRVLSARCATTQGLGLTREEIAEKKGENRREPCGIELNRNQLNYTKMK